MKPSKNSARSLFRLLALAAGIFVFSTPAIAYDEDTHFNMTYVLLRSVGFDHDEALLVAAVDQGMDDSPDTIANHGIIPRCEEEWLWHALDRKGKMHAAGILARRDQLFMEALREPKERNKLIRLGVFFHYQQDTWAHRHHGKSNHLSRDNYTPFTTPLGHGLYGHVPDEPPLDPVAALMNLEDGIVYARRFLKEGLGRDPSPFLADYIPQGGRVDAGWPDKRKGKYFNEIDRSDAAFPSPRRYLLDLIWSQIYVYKEGLNFFPHYFLRDTAEVADVDCVREALQKVSEEYKLYPDTNIPTTDEKDGQGFCRLTTAELLKFPLPDGVPSKLKNKPCRSKNQPCK